MDNGVLVPLLHDARSALDFVGGLVRHAEAAVIAADADGAITLWNEGAVRAYGYSAAEATRDLNLAGLFAWAGCTPCNPDELVRRVAAADGVQGVRRSGERFAFEGAALRLPPPAGDRPGYLLIVCEECPQVRQRALASAEDRFHGLLEAAPDAMVGVGDNGCINVVNTRCERMFGYHRDELLGRPIEILVPDKLRAAHVEHRARYVRHPVAREMGAGMELLARRRDGTELPVEVSLSSLRTPDGELVLAAVRDVTERRRIARQLADKNEELQRAILARNNFLSTMSHELRTPLNAVIGFTGTLLMRLPGPLTADQEHQLKTVQASAKQLLSLINDLLDLAKIDSGRVQVSWEPVDCRRLVQEVVRSVRPLADGKGLTLDVDAPDGPVEARSDRRALGQIVTNLVHNAIKFTERGGVRVGVLPAEADRPVRIAVRDTGPGLPEGDLPQVFEVFGRNPTTAKNGDQGNRLGLHMCQRLARLLGADLAVSSTPGVGSTFTIALTDPAPAVEEPAEG